MAEINLGNDETINATLSTEEPITSEVLDINYIPGYVVAEQERRANEIVRQSNEEDRVALYNDMESKLESGYFNGQDGVGLEYDWQGTSLGVKREDESDYEYANLKGETGSSGQDATINGVNTLNIQAGQNINISQSGSTMTISSTGGGASEYVVGLTKENDEITSDKTISEIITAYNDGNIVKGVLTDTEAGVDFNLSLLIAFEDSEFGLVQFATVYDSGDDFKSITIIGTLENNEDSWQYLDKEIVSDSDYVHTDNNYTTNEKNKLAGLENKIITVNADPQTMQLDKNADEIENYLNNGYIVMALGYQVFRKDYNASTHTIQLAIYFGAFGQVITVTGNQVTGVSEYFYANDNNYVHTDNNFTTYYKDKLDNAPEVVDLSNYSVGDTISDTALVSKLMNDRCKIKYGGTIYSFATTIGTGYIYTVMNSLTAGAFITLNYNSESNTFYFYEVGTAPWESPSNKVQNLSAPTTDTYPSTLAVYNAFQNVFRIRTDLTSGSNLNSLLTGIYNINNISHNDFPITGAVYGVLVQYSGNYKPQMFIAGGAGECKVYYRRWLTASNSFTSWESAETLCVSKDDIATTLDSSSTDDEVASAKAVYDALQNAGGGDSEFIIAKDTYYPTNISRKGLAFVSSTFLNLVTNTGTSVVTPNLHEEIVRYLNIAREKFESTDYCFINIYFNNGLVYLSGAFLPTDTINISNAKIFNNQGLVNKVGNNNYIWDATNNTYTTSGNFVLSREYTFVPTTANTISYTPTGDYNPATKKYVDDSIKLNYIVAYNDTSQTISTADTSMKYLINTVESSSGSKLVFHNSDGTSKANSIEIGSGVNHVEISGQVYIGNYDVSTIKTVYIYKNDSELIRNAKTVSSNYEALPLPTIIVPVSQGDTISLYVRSTTGTGTTLRQGLVNNFLMVKVLD